MYGPYIRCEICDMFYLREHINYISVLVHISYPVCDECVDYIGGLDV